MVVLSFRFGDPKYPVMVTIQEEEAETALAQLDDIEDYLKAKSDFENDSGGKPPSGWFTPPTIN